MADAKTVSQRVDQAVDKERRRLSALSASIAHQDAQRSAGIYEPDSPPTAPRAGARAASGYALRSPRPPRDRPSATELKRGHLYLGRKGTFLLWVDRRGQVRG